MTEKTTISLGNVQTTLFLPLWGRAFESKKVKPLLIDKTAVRILEAIEYDFSTIAENISELTQMAWIMRSLCIDEVVNAFIGRFPKSTIVNIGCGMDTTFDRIDNGTLLWYDLDLPDVIELRSESVLAFLINAAVSSAVALSITVLCRLLLIFWLPSNPCIRGAGLNKGWGSGKTGCPIAKRSLNRRAITRV